MMKTNKVAKEEAETFKGTLCARAQKIGLHLSSRQLQQFYVFAQLLVSFNERMNLTTITEPDDIISLHFLDSVAVWPELAGELRALTLQTPHLQVADIGTGAGFPGIPLKILVPQLSLTLIDGTRKKIHFLDHVIHTLPLNRAQAIHGRAEELAHSAVHRGQYDLVVARGLAPWAPLMEYVLPFVREGGLCLAYKGPGFREEFQAAHAALNILNADVERIIPVIVPDRDLQRFVVVIRKRGRTPRRYPRGQGLPRRQPLMKR